MKRNKTVVAILLAMVMILSLTVAVACQDGDTGRKTELVLWGPSNSQTFLKEWADKWAADYTDSQGRKYTVKMGIMGEGEAGTTVMNAPSDAADVFSFADDQLTKLVDAGALASLGNPTAVGTTAERVAKANSEGSVSAATYKGQLYAYPMTADNGYFLYYNSKFLSEDQIKDWETIFSVAQTNSKEVHFNVTDAWYAASLFFAFGGEVSTTATNFDTAAVGIKALKAAHKLYSYGDTLLMADPNSIDQKIQDETIIAAVAGGWIYNAAAKNTDIKLAILPQITIDAETVRLKSFLGSKLMGVNAQGRYLEASHALADYLTGEEVQTARATALTAGPSNINAADSEAVKSLPTVQTLAAQAEYSVPQVNLPAGFWNAIKKPIEAMLPTNKQIADYYTSSGGYNTVNMQVLLNTMKTEFNLVAA